MQKTLVFIVPHTHWDREWYLTAEDFRFFLCKVMDKVLHLLETQEEYKFTLDGQVLPLLDYLEVRPEKATAIRKFVQAKRLCIGPWFSQPDEFLVSGEALIRNLLFGIEIARGFGGAMLHGYIPDAFGHIAQLPQVLKGFGIETAFVMRGAEEAAEKLGTNEFLWVAPDGTTVACHVLETGYCNGVDLTTDLNKWPRSLEWLRPRAKLTDGNTIFVAFLQFLARRSQTGAALLLHGCDHREPNELLLATVEKLSQALPQYDFIIATLEEYGELLKEKTKSSPKIYGELRRSIYHPILPGVLSTRIYLKQAETLSETLLEKYAEPLAALTRLAGVDLRPFLRRAWYTLLQNNAHDSICGTGIDAVHNEMMTRFAQVQSLATSVIKESLTRIGQSLAAEKSGDASILVFNPSPWPCLAEIEVFIKDTAANSVQTPDGKQVPLVIEKRSLVDCCDNVLQGVEIVQKRRALWQDELPPFGIKTYKLIRGHIKKDYTKMVVASDTLENEFYKLKVHPDGTFDILDKENALEFHGMHVFEDLADKGDEYTFDPLPNDRAVTSQGLKGRIQTKLVAPWRAELTVTIKLPLPLGLTSNRIRRAKRKVLLPICTTFSLRSGVKRVEILTKVENNAQDHRLRVLFPTGWINPNIAVDKTFAVLDHAFVRPPQEWVVERPTPTFPQKLFVAVEQNGFGVAVINRGLPECEVTKDGTVCLTLLRAVGWLSRDDLHTRRGHAGPPLATPGAQCRGTHTFNYALYSYRGTWHSSGLLPIAQAFLAPPIGIELYAMPLLERSFISWDSEEIVLSACKPAEDGKGLVVRLYNACGKPVRAQVHINFPIKEIWLARLDETPIALAKLKNGSLEIEFDKWQIKTLKLML